MMRTVARKMGISEGSRAYFVNAPEDSVETIQLPKIEVVSKLTGDFDYIHLFVKTQDEFNNHFPKLKPHLAQKGMLWVSLNRYFTLKSLLPISN